MGPRFSGETAADSHHDEPMPPTISPAASAAGPEIVIARPRAALWRPTNTAA
jgi:hypothetical protein